MNRWRRIIAEVLPPPRRPLTRSVVMPPAVFLALFVGAWFYLDAAGIIRFSTWKPLLLLPAMPWAWWTHTMGYSGLARGRWLAALLVRLSVIGAFIMLLGEPRAVRRSDVLSVVYAVDVSDSIGERSVNHALKYVVDSVSGQGEGNEAGLVVFGRDAAVEVPPRISFARGFEEVINSRIGRDATDLGKALGLAAAMIPERNNGRVVLVSDGVNTEGPVSTTVLDELKGRGVPVDVLPISYDYQNEVWLEKIELPRHVKIGDTYEAAVVLGSLRAGSGKLTLRENGRVIHESEVQYGPGKNRYVLPLYLRAPGFYEYVATIAPPEGMDGRGENNVAIGYLFIEGEGKVMVVTNPGGKEEDWRPLVASLKKTEHVVELRPPYEFPRDALSLSPYDGVVFVNVPADAFDAVQMQALRDAVYSQGVGFLMVGGANSFGPGGYHRTPIEETLPVTMDIKQRKILPKGALVIVLHTCEFAEGNTWGKRVAKHAISVLGEQDEAGVLAYGNAGEYWVFPLMPLSKYDDMILAINQAALGDMPSFATTMEMGLTSLQASDAAAKHMIIISDGDPSPPTPQMLQQFRDAQISISTVAINPHSGTETTTLSLIASATGGRFYFPQDPAQLPGIFIKEAKTLKRSLIENRTFVPEASFPSPVLKGIESIPQLHGLVLTTAKPRANVVLETPPEKGGKDRDPVLAVWRYGVGKAAAFTSDLGPNWAADWVPWGKYDAIVRQLMLDVRRAKVDSSLTMRAFAEGGTGMIFVEDAPRGADAETAAFLDIEARVRGPRDREVSVALQQVGPRRYRGAFALWGTGRYHVTSVGVGGGRNERVSGGFALPYSAEYRRFRSNPIVLKMIAERTGGRVLTGKETAKDIFLRQRAPREASRSVVDLFLLVLACMVPLDVAVRRVQLDWSVIRGWFGFARRKAPSTATLGALLKRKSEIAQTHRPAGEKPLGPPTGGVQPAKRPPRPPKTPPGAVPEPSKPEEGAPASTTARLLEMKKQWKKD